MPHTLSAKKRLRQSETRRVYNKAIKSEIKTWTRKLAQAVEEKDKALAEVYFKTAVSKIDKSVKKGIFHKNTGARKKSSCAKALASLSS